MQARVWVAFLLGSLEWQVTAQTVAQLIDNGPPANRIDLVVLGDGYTAAESTKFATDVQNFVLNIFAQEPYREYQRYFNVYRIDVVSAESGADHEPTLYRDTALGATYPDPSAPRFLVVDNRKVFDLVNSLLLPSQRDLVLVLVNDTAYGGSGGALAVISTHPSAVELVLHEIAHSLALLADEYYPYGTCLLQEPPAANVTAATTREMIKWNIWIDPQTPIPTTGFVPAVPGLYEGAKYCTTGLYRPTYDSKMRTLFRPFEQINTEQHVKRFYNWVSTIDAYSPAGPVALRRSEKQAFSVTTPSPFTHTLKIAWFIDGEEQSTGSGFLFDPSGVSAGTHSVRVRVHDPTDMVRNDPDQVLTDTLEWMVTVTEMSDVATVTSVIDTTAQYSDSAAIHVNVQTQSGAAVPAGSVAVRITGDGIDPVVLPSAVVDEGGRAHLPYTVTLPQGTYQVAAEYAGAGRFLPSTGTGKLSVVREDAVVTLLASSPQSIPVAVPGGRSPAFTLSAAIEEEPDQMPGEISRSVPVRFRLVPSVSGSGGNAPACTADRGTLSGGVLTVSCTFVDVPVNVYMVRVELAGDYYSGETESLVSVFDPSQPAVTGGGSIMRGGVRANFGFSAKYLKNGQAHGSLLYVEHRPGADIVLQSDMICTLVLVANVAVFVGRATLNGGGNYTFQVTAIDNGEPGINDAFGLELRDQASNAIATVTFRPTALADGNVQLGRSVPNRAEDAEVRTYTGPPGPKSAADH